MNRLECVVETLRHALSCLAAVVPEWLREHMRAEWADCFGRRADGYRLPKIDTQREAFAEQVGADGWELLSAVFAPDAPDRLARVPAVDTMRLVWLQRGRRASALAALERHTAAVADDQLALRRRGALRAQA